MFKKIKNTTCAIMIVAGSLAFAAPCDYGDTAYYTGSYTPYGSWSSIGYTTDTESIVRKGSDRNSDGVEVVTLVSEKYKTRQKVRTYVCSTTIYTGSCRSNGQDDDIFDRARVPRGQDDDVLGGGSSSGGADDDIFDRGSSRDSGADDDIFGGGGSSRDRSDGSDDDIFGGGSNGSDDDILASNLQDAEVVQLASYSRSCRYDGTRYYYTAVDYGTERTSLGSDEVEVEVAFDGAPLVPGETERIKVSYDGRNIQVSEETDYGYYRSSGIQKERFNRYSVEIEGTRKLTNPNRNVQTRVEFSEGKVVIVVTNDDVNGIVDTGERVLDYEVYRDTFGWKNKLKETGSEVLSSDSKETRIYTGVRAENGKKYFVKSSAKYSSSDYYNSASTRKKDSSKKKYRR